MSKAPEGNIAAIESRLEQPDFICYLKGRLYAGEFKCMGTSTGRIPSEAPARSQPPKRDFEVAGLPFDTAAAEAPAPGYEFVWDWYVERIDTGNIFRAAGLTEAALRKRFTTCDDLILQRIDISKRQVLIPSHNLGRNIDTHA